MKSLLYLTVGLWATTCQFVGVCAQTNSTQAPKYALNINGTTHAYNQTATIKQFDVYWSIDEPRNTISFAIQVNSRNRPGWIGLGASPTGGMVGSRVVVAAQDTSGKLSITEYQLSAKSSSGLQAVSTNARVTSNTVAALRMSVNGLSIQENANSNIVIAIGNAPNPGERITYMNSPTENKIIVSEMVTSQSSFIMVHGILMAIGWLILVPVGMVFGSPTLRRRLFPGNKSGNPPYTRAHRHTQFVAFITITAAFGIAKAKLSDVGIGISRSMLIKPKAARNPWKAAVNIFIGIGLAGFSTGLYVVAGILALLGGAAFFWSSYLVKKMSKFTGAARKATQAEENLVSMENRVAIETAGTA
ncbi:hypothetical protein BDF22DRAFT_741988 [Syncephalis plumigaleata]|nr:hypothetical protein BDF22DRAFT_741988 [Syncephalis plumigaleata]